MLFEVLEQGKEDCVRQGGTGSRNTEAVVAGSLEVFHARNLDVAVLSSLEEGCLVGSLGPINRVGLESSQPAEDQSIRCCTYGYERRHPTEASSQGYSNR